MNDDKHLGIRQKGQTPDVHGIEATAKEIADGFIHHLAPAFRPPARLICPSDAAEEAVVEAVIQAARARGIPTEVIDFRSTPVERLHAVTARLDGWRSVSLDGDSSTVPKLLILCGFDVFGDDEHDEATYPFRSQFQFDHKFLWLFIGRDWRRMWWLFGSDRRPLYKAAADITPAHWRFAKKLKVQQVGKNPES